MNGCIILDKSECTYDLEKLIKIKESTHDNINMEVLCFKAEKRLAYVYPGMFSLNFEYTLNRLHVLILYFPYLFYFPKMYKNQKAIFFTSVKCNFYLK